MVRCPFCLLLPRIQAMRREMWKTGTRSPKESVDQCLIIWLWAFYAAFVCFCRWRGWSHPILLPSVGTRTFILSLELDSTDFFSSLSLFWGGGMGCLYEEVVFFSVWAPEVSFLENVNIIAYVHPESYCQNSIFMNWLNDHWDIAMSVCKPSLAIPFDVSWCRLRGLSVTDWAEKLLN